jgi:hypothetical protein
MSQLQRSQQASKHEQAKKEAKQEQGKQEREQASFQVRNYRGSVSILGAGVDAMAAKWLSYVPSDAKKERGTY